MLVLPVFCLLIHIKPFTVIHSALTGKVIMKNEKQKTALSRRDRARPCPSVNMKLPEKFRSLVEGAVKCEAFD